MSLLLAFAILFPPALAADLDGDGVDGATDCDDADPLVYRSETSTSSYTITSAGASSFCTGYCSRTVGTVNLKADTTSGLQCLESVNTMYIDEPSLTSLSGLSGLEKAGVIHLMNSNLTDLSGLTSLKTLSQLLIGCEGAPTIRSSTSWADIADAAEEEACGDGLNPSLTSLSGLDGLTSLDLLFIWKVSSLTSLGGLEGVTEAGTVVLYGTNGLTSLTGLEGLTSVDRLFVAHQDGLTGLRGLDNLSEAGSIGVIGTSLSSLVGLRSLSKLDGLYMQSARAMLSLRGLEGLDSIGKVQLDTMPALKDLHGLDNVTSVSELTIRMADNLTGLDGLESVETIGWLQLGCAASETKLGNIGCRGLLSLASLEALSSATLIGTMDLVHLPALTSLSGLEGLTGLTNLTIDGTGLVDLTGLSGITSVSGTYQIGCHIYEDAWDDEREQHWKDRVCLGNPSLVSLDGMESMTKLAALRLVNNSVLEDVSALGSLETLTSLQIANNPMLSDLSVIGAPLTDTSSIWIGCSSGNYSIDYDLGGSYTTYNCYGASATTSLPQVSGTSLDSLVLYDLPLVTSLDGLYSMGSASFVALERVGLTDLRGLEDLESPTYLWIGCRPRYDDSDSEYVSPAACTGMSSLETLDGLDALTEVGDLRVSMNRELSDIDALTGLTLADNITFRTNYSLTTSYINATIAEIDRVTGTKTVSGSAP